MRTPRYIYPFLYRSTNTCITAALRSSSIVNRKRSQSQEQPNVFNCSIIMPPYFSFHSHAYFKNSSRERSCFEIPFSRNIATTFASVAIDAWSVPGTQHVFLPCMRARRTSTSCMVLFSTCPMCNTPVTFGGGITIVYGSRPSGSEWKNFFSTQYLYQRSSAAAGSYIFEISIVSLICVQI